VACCRGMRRNVLVASLWNVENVRLSLIDPSDTQGRDIDKNCAPAAGCFLAVEDLTRGERCTEKLRKGGECFVELRMCVCQRGRAVIEVPVNISPCLRT